MKALSKKMRLTKFKRNKPWRCLKSVDDHVLGYGATRRAGQGLGGVTKEFKKIKRSKD